jgi:hypothetical protein
VRHTESKPTARGFGTVVTLLRPSTQQSPAAPVFDGVFRLIANHHDLAIFESAPEVRALCSAGLPSFNAPTTLSVNHNRACHARAQASLGKVSATTITSTDPAKCQRILQILTSHNFIRLSQGIFHLAPAPQRVGAVSHNYRLWNLVNRELARFAPNRHRLSTMPAIRRDLALGIARAEMVNGW